MNIIYMDVSPRQLIDISLSVNHLFSPCKRHPVITRIALLRFR